MPVGSLALEKRGHIAYLTLKRPQKQNAIDGALLRELADACQAIGADEDVRVALLAAEGSIFCRGWDWQALPERALVEPFGPLAELSRPVVCALNGDALSAGLELALEMILTAEPIDAQEALRVGLVSEVVPAVDLMVQAEALAARIAERGPQAVRYAKEAIQQGLEMPLEQALRYETDLTIIIQTTGDRAEGVRAFLEKRQPRFKGK